MKKTGLVQFAEILLLSGCHTGTPCSLGSFLSVLCETMYFSETRCSRSKKHRSHCLVHQMKQAPRKICWKLPGNLWKWRDCVSKPHLTSEWLLTPTTTCFGRRKHSISFYIHSIFCRNVSDGAMRDKWQNMIGGDAVLWTPQNEIREDLKETVKNYLFLRLRMGDFKQIMHEYEAASHVSGLSHFAASHIRFFAGICRGDRFVCKLPTTSFRGTECNHPVSSMYAGVRRRKCGKSIQGNLQ